MSRAKQAVFYLTCFACVYLASSTSSGSSLANEVDVCSEEHKFRCQERQLISLTSLVCGNESACPLLVNMTLFDFCQGQQTCSNMGLADVLASQCGRNVTRRRNVRVRFTCVPGTSSSCRSDICADPSSGLVCPNGTVVHIRGMTCGSVTGKCPMSSYTNMHVCEGANHCSSSGLTALLPQSCQRDVGGRRNVVVHYVCVSGTHIDSTCTPGKNRTLDKEFGILRSSIGATSKGQVKSPCTWYINPSTDKIVKVIVHMVNAKVTQGGCDPRVLSVTFTDCRSRSEVTKGFCNVSNSGSEVISCGPTWIRSAFLPGEESADMFVVSYQTYSSNGSSVEPRGLPSCLAPPEIGSTQTASPTHTLQASRTSARPSPKSISVGRNYGPGDGLFEYRDSAYQEDVAGSGNNDDSSSLSKHLKLMILYIFFGVVILVLAVALIAVIVSYHNISKLKEHRVDSNEKTALWTHNEETPLETFLNNNLVESSGTLAAETSCGPRADHDTDQVVATIHCEGGAEQGQSPARLSAGSGVSTFLAGRKDSQSRDMARSARSSSLASNVSFMDVQDGDQRNDHNSVGLCGYIDVGKVGHVTPPSGGDDDHIYEAVAANYPQASVRDSDSAQSAPFRPNIIANERSYKGKLYEVVNNDPAVVGLQRSSSSDPHYRNINNDEYAIVTKAGKRASSPKTPNNEDQPWANNYQDGEDRVDFRPTSGPYDRKRASTDNSSTRWSNGEGRWTDEV